MARNVRTPAGVNDEGSGKCVGLVGDTFQIAPHRSEIQKNHLRTRFGLSPSMAAVVADIAFPKVEHWTGAR